MNLSPLNNAPDELLVLLIRDKAQTESVQELCYHLLEERHLSGLLRRVTRRIRNPRFLAAVQCVEIDHFCLQVFVSAIRNFDPGRGSFEHFLARVLTNAITSGLRAMRRLPLETVDCHGKDLTDQLPFRERRSSWVDPALRREALVLARGCILQMNDRDRLAFVWTALLGIDPSQLRDIWPTESLANLKQIPCRAKARFIRHWTRLGGADMKELLPVGTVALMERLDPAEIRDPLAREAYREWVIQSSITVVASGLRIPIEHARTRILKALQEIFKEGVERGIRIIVARLGSVSRSPKSDFSKRENAA